MSYPGSRPADLGGELAEVMQYLASLEFMLPHMPDQTKQELRQELTTLKPKLRRLANGQG
jgi:hypothetical protein